MLKVVVNVDLTKYLIVKIDAQNIIFDINLENILNAVSYELGIPIQDIISKSRKGKLPDARKMYCLLARSYTKKSLLKIGEVINCDHATVLFAIKKAQSFMESKGETEFQHIYNFIKERLNLK